MEVSLGWEVQVTFQTTLFHRAPAWLLSWMAVHSPYFKANRPTVPVRSL